MTSNRSLRSTLSFLFATGVVLAPVAAWAANTCAQSSDCPKGFSCQVTEVATPCPAIACAAGETCTQPTCDPETISSCAALPCTADSDCASGMVCFAQTIDSCAGATCGGARLPTGREVREADTDAGALHRDDDAVMRPQVPLALHYGLGLWRRLHLRS